MTLSAQEALAAIAEMERNTPEQIKRLRSHQRIAIRAKVTVQPGNSSQRTQQGIDAVLGDISRGGCQLLSPEPLGVGDIYHLAFQRDDLDLEPVFARCLRCRLIREGAFECGFGFFKQLDLSHLEDAQSSSASAAPHEELFE